MNTNFHRFTAAWIIAPAALALCVLCTSCSHHGAGGDDIIAAAKQGDSAKIEALLKDNPALVSSKDKDGMTPLNYAAFQGYKSAAEVLVAHGADVNARANDGDTPLREATDMGHDDVAELLRQHGAHD